ncbi:PA14 domain-containing protein [Marixanthomonas ophiurae]|uniref:PA14 domain-containing protein n=1 Tax=Marixanthomonas ophiurae TaxID=387659 RepID=A0A3E1Q9F9_9FLAO|nr:PA14 domain-containing protein [Marixanthomonas ophiurae]RFN58759.1 hypothetical protein DZ858_01365 [Marixanthomonas ophiurae]
MYKKILPFFISFSFLTASAQIGINTTNIDNGVMLEIDSDDSGILIPRITLSSTTDNTTIPGTLTNGTLIYNTTANATLQEGFYYWQNTEWVLISTGSNDNVYTTNGTLNTNRTINTGTNIFQLSGEALRNGFSLKRTNNSLERGLSFQNSGNNYDASIFMESNTGSGLVFATGGNVSDASTLGRTLTLQDDQSITFDTYGSGTFTGTPTQNLMVDTDGNVIEEALNYGVQFYSYNITPAASPDLNALERNNTVSRSGFYTGNLNNVNALKPSNDDGFVIKIVGTYEVQNTGVFNFSEDSDDGARIYVDGSLVLNGWADSGSGQVNTGGVRLAKGKHTFEFWYYENAGGEAFSFSWGTNADGNSGVINASQFTVE